MSVSSFVRKVLRGAEAERHGGEVEAELKRQKALIRQNVQCMQSGSRVMGTMAGMMKLMTEAERGGDHS